MNIIDITIPLSDKTPVWEGEKGITIKSIDRIDDTSDFNVSRIELGVHSGTHIDAPYHLFKNGITADQIPLDALIGGVQVVGISEGISVIDKNCLMNLDIKDGIERILFKTSNSRYWVSDRYSFNRDYIALNSQGARYLVDMDLKLVGIDYFSVSVYDDLIQPHKIFLDHGVVILENIDLRQVTLGLYELICLPLKIVGTDGAPVRAILFSK